MKDLNDKELGLGFYDKEMINFMVDDAETLDVKAKGAKAFEDTAKVRKVGYNYEYIFQRKRESGGAIIGDELEEQVVHDDTDVDLVKVTRKLQIDKERDEVFAEKLGQKYSKFHDLKTLLEDS